jgi:thiol-disulfide isomerase/thioredoxin
MKGKDALFLVFWATWCSVCKTEIPKLKEIHETYATKGMPLIAIDVSVNDSLKKVEKYLEDHKITYPVIFDEGSKITKLYGVQGTPTVVIVDRGGIVRYRSAAIPDDLKDHFSGLMKEPGS